MQSIAPYDADRFEPGRPPPDVWIVVPVPREFATCDPGRLVRHPFVKVVERRLELGFVDLEEV